MLLGAALVAVALTLAPAAVEAAPTWLPPTDLSATGRSAKEPAVAVDPQGDAVAVWDRSNGKNLVVQSSIRPAGSAWQAPVALSEEGVASYGPDVAFDAVGNATAIWVREGTGEEFETVIQSSVRLAGSSSWEKPVDLVKGGQSQSVALAVNEAGAAAAVWERFKEGEDALLAATRPSASGAWQTPVRLAAGFGEPAVAIDPAGDAVAAWREIVEGESAVVASYRPAATQTWGAPLLVSFQKKGTESKAPQVAIDGHGNAVAVWEHYNGSIDVVQSAVRPAASGIWQEPVRVSAPGAETLQPKLAMNPQGDAVAVWQHNIGGETVIQAALLPAASGAWQEPVNLSAKEGSAFEAQIAINPRGDAVAVWQRNNGSNAIVQAAVRPAASGAWGEPANLSALGENALEVDTAVDEEGNAVAAWQRSDGTHTIAQSAGYDAAGPLLLGVSIPASGVAGQPLSFSVSPLDAWSAIGSTDWSFGDGTSATGAAVAHTYAAPGTYPVSLSSADVLGNPTTASGSVTIVPRRRRSLAARCAATVHLRREPHAPALPRRQAEHRHLGQEGTAGNELPLRAVDRRQGADPCHHHGARAAPRSQLRGADREAETDARQALHSHAAARHAHPLLGVPGPRHGRVQWSHRPTATGRRFLQGDAHREQRRRPLRACDAELRRRALRAYERAAVVGTGSRRRANSGAQRSGSAPGGVASVTRVATSP